MMNAPPSDGQPQSEIFLVYQIEFTYEKSGKRIATSKRKIKWKFGFPNETAVNDGMTGNDCRGEEHEIILSWSITSGKRRITCDGQEVHIATSRSNTLDASWPMKGNHIVKVVACAAPPLSAEKDPNFRQFELLLDGRSFFTMPKVYELGVRGTIQSRARIPGALPENGYRSPTSYQEQDEVKRAIALSLEEQRNHFASKPSMSSRSSRTEPPTPGRNDYRSPAPVPTAPAPAVDLLDMEHGAPPAADLSALTHQLQLNPSAPAAYSSGSYSAAAAPPPPVTYHQSPATAAGAMTVFTALSPAPQVDALDDAIASFPYAPQSMPLVDDPFAPKAALPPSHNDIASAILGAYGGEAHPQTPASSYHPTHNNNNNAPFAFHTPQVQHPAAAAPPANVTTPLQSMHTPLAIESAKEEPKSGVDAALQKLVNFDNIDAPASEQLTLTMMNKPKEGNKKAAKTSRGIPPRSSGVPAGASLEQMKQAQLPPTAQTIAQSIMKAPPQLAFHPNAVQAGALVVHGNGPPLLQQGFGVGGQQMGGGYGVQAQPMQYQHQQQYAVSPPQQLPIQQTYNNY